MVFCVVLGAHGTTLLVADCALCGERPQLMSRGNLTMVLQDPALVLDWSSRIAIALDVARGMEFLHVCVPCLRSFRWWSRMDAYWMIVRCESYCILVVVAVLVFLWCTHGSASTANLSRAATLFTVTSKA